MSHSKERSPAIGCRRCYLGSCRSLSSFVLWNFLFSRMGAGAGAGLMQIGKSKAKVYIEKTTGVTFADVEGIDEAEEGAHRGRRVSQAPGKVSTTWAAIFPKAF